MILIAALAAAVSSGTALLLAALGEVLAERSGVMNLGVEGMMLIGALAGFATTVWTGNLWLGLLASLFAGGLLAALHAVLTVTFGADQIVSGLALTLFATGLASFLGKPLVGQAAPVSFRAMALPLLADIPILGPIFFRQNALTYLSYVLAIGLWIVLFRTHLGLLIRAVGDSPATVDATGHSVPLLRSVAVIVGGMFAGLGGAAIALGTNPSWTENITAGRGWIAVALVVFATWNPLRAVLGAYLFGSVEAAQFLLQAAGVAVSAFFLNMLPYVATILVLLITTQAVARQRLGAPAALGMPYRREARA